MNEREMSPADWVERSLLELVELPSGQVDPRQEPYCHWPLLAPNHIEPGSGRWTTIETAAAQHAVSGKYVFEPGDVVYSKIRPYLRKAALVRQRGLCSADMYPLRARHELEPGYLLAVLLSEDFTEFAASCSARTGIPKINRTELAQYKMKLPPLGEQRKIAAILASADETIEKTEAVIAQLQAVKKAMMQELLTRGLPGRHTRFQQTELGELPHSWQVTPLGALLDGIDAGWSPQCEQRPADLEAWGVLKVSSVTRGFYSQEEHKALPAGLAPKPEIEVRAGDVLLARANGVLDLVGRTCYVWNTRPRLMLSDKVLRLRPKAALLQSLFLHLVMNLDLVRRQVLEGTGGSHMRNVSQDALRKVLVPLPSLPEQEQIQGSITSILQIEAKETEYLRALTASKAALMSVLLTGQVRVTPDGDTP